MIYHENDYFKIEVGEVKGKEEGPFYLVISKKSGMIEFYDKVFYYVRSWANDMASALEDKEEPVITAEVPDGTRPN